MPFKMKKNHLKFAAVFLMFIASNKSLSGQFYSSKKFKKNHIDFTISTQPNGWGGDNANVGFQLSFPEWVPFLAFRTNFNFSSDDSIIGKFQKSSNEFSVNGEVKFHLFSLRKDIEFPEVNNGKTSCLNKIEKSLPAFMRSAYVALGIEAKNIHLEYLPPEPDDIIVKPFTYDIKDNGFTLGLGYQFNVLGSFLIDIGYDWKFSQPKWSGPVDIFEQTLYTNDFPTSFRVVGRTNISIGLTI